MSSTTEVLTFADLYTDFLNRCRSSTTATAGIALAKRYVNTALVDIHMSPGRSKFEWAHRRGALITHAPYSTGTVSITAATSRTAVVGASTLWTTAVDGFGFNNVRVGGKIKFAGLNEIYNVSAVGSATGLTLESVYTGADLAAETYQYYEDEYALASDFLKFVDLNMFSTDLNIPLIGGQEFRRRFGRNDISGKPRVASHIQLKFSTTTAPQHRIVINPYPDDEYSIPYWYVTSNLAMSSAGVEQTNLVEDTDEPIIPRQSRHVIVLHALYNFFRDYKDDTRSQEAKAEYIDTMRRLLGDFDVGGDKAQFIVRQHDQYRKQRFDVGDRFDSLRDRRWR